MVLLKPVAPGYAASERSTHLVRTLLHLQTPDPMHLNLVQQRVSDGLLDRVLEDTVALHAIASRDCDVVLIEGLVPDRSEPYTAKLNAEIAKALNAEILLVASGRNRTVQQVQSELKIQLGIFGGAQANLLGCVINKAGRGPRHTGIPSVGEITPTTQAEDFSQLKLNNCPLLGTIPWTAELISPAHPGCCTRALNAEILNAGELDTRRVMRIAMGARSLGNMIDVLRPGTLLVAPGDRDDILVAAAMAATNGTPLAGLLLTHGIKPAENLINLCRSALQTGIPVLQTHLDTFATAQQLTHMDTQVAIDDADRVQLIMETVANHLDMPTLMQQLGQPHASRLSPGRVPLSDGGKSPRGQQAHCAAGR